MTKREFILERAPGVRIFGDIRIPASPEGCAVLIFCHGFKGFKNWGGWQYGMDRIAEAGFHAVAMNFSHNGTGDDLVNFTELEKFADNTIGKELGDIEFLIDELISGKTVPEICRSPKIGLIGHSRGGGTVVLAADRDDRIACITTWAGISNFDNYLARRKEWHEAGHLEFHNARTGQMMRMNLDFLHDLEWNAGERNILEAKKNLTIPHFIIHGERDETVPVDHALMLKKSAGNAPSKLEIIPGANHTFGQKHPFEGSNPEFDDVLAKTIDWFRKNM